MWQRGITGKELLLALAVLLVAGAVLIPIAMSMQGRQLAEGDLARMRRVYVALVMYEEQVDANLAPSLVAVAPYADAADFASAADPFVGAGVDSYPNDPGLPDGARSAPSRISFSYLYAFVNAGNAKAKPWAEAKFDPSIGLLANEWLGSVTAGRDFHAIVGGPVHRLMTDGSATTLRREGRKPLGDVQDLFFGKG